MPDLTWTRAGLVIGAYIVISLASLSIFSLPAIGSTDAANITINSSLVHLGDDGSSRWASYGPPVGTSWQMPFSLQLNPSAATLSIWLADVDYKDSLFVNNTFVGYLANTAPYNDLSVGGTWQVSLGTGVLRSGTNSIKISVEQQGSNYDDIGFGTISLSVAFAPPQPGMSWSGFVSDTVDLLTNLPRFSPPGTSAVTLDVGMIKQISSQIGEAVPELEAAIQSLTGGPIVTAACPVDIVITDPSGKRLSSSLQEIAGAQYEVLPGDGDEPWKVCSFDRGAWLDGAYQIEVVPESGADPNALFSLFVIDPLTQELIVLANGQEIGTEPQFFSVPEPATLSLLAMGVMAAVLRRRRR